MAINLDLKVIGAEILARKFKDASQRVPSVIKDKMRTVLFGLEGKIKDKLSNKVLKVRTGRYRSSITSKIEGAGSDITGKVGTNVVYAPVHEYGATIAPKRRKYLTFQVEGHWVSVKAVKIPKRPIWEPTLKESQDKIRSLFRTAFAELLR